MPDKSIPPTLISMIGEVRKFGCGDRHIIALIGRDSETQEPLLIHHSLDREPLLYFVSTPECDLVKGSTGRELAGRAWHTIASENARFLFELLPPLTGQIYQHYKGGKYKVIATGYRTIDMLQVIIYQSLDRPDEEPWVRQYESGPSPWLSTIDGTTERFKLCSG